MMACFVAHARHATGEFYPGRIMSPIIYHVAFMPRSMRMVDEM